MLTLVAVALLWQAAGTNPIDSAITLTREHRYAEAKKALVGVAVPANPAAAISFHRLRASIDAGLHLYPEADAEMQAALELSPDDRRLRTAAAMTAALAGDSEEKNGKSLEAVHSYERAVQLNPAEERYPLGLAIELLQHQTFEPAFLVLNTAIARFPRSAPLRAALGVAFFASGTDIDKAYDAFLNALDIDPEFTAARDYLLESAILDRRAPNGRVVHSVCGYADGHPGEPRANAVCGFLELKIAEAANDPAALQPVLNRLKSAAEEGPTIAVTRCQYGRALVKAQRWREARAELEACTRLDPQSPEGHFLLMKVYGHLDEKKLETKEAELKQRADRYQAEANDHRDRATTQFLYTLQHPAGLSHEASGH